MAPGVRKIHRRRDDGQLVIEQTRDWAQVAAVLAATGLSAVMREQPGSCALLASVGIRPVGLAVLTTQLDVAVVDVLAVIAELRGRGIGTALLAAARAAAHPRGARTLYALAPAATGGFFQRHGFGALERPAARAALGGFHAAEGLASPATTASCDAWFLDISRDGLVTR